MTSPANLHRGNIRITPLSVESSVHPSVVSKAKRVLDICGAIIGLALTGAIAIPVAIAPVSSKAIVLFQNFGMIF